MVRCGCFIVSYCFFISFTFGQTGKARLSGEVLDAANVGINNCTIKATNIKNGIILAYFNIGDKNSFSTMISVDPKDSIAIEISHVAYATQKKVRLAESLATNRLTFILNTRNKLLDAVKVTAPSTWVRGDTTFNKVSAYKEGEEKKLKDILLKMPDFSLDDHGKVVYKKQAIEKITIDHEELFADKTELLMNNLPIHILNTVQAIENQSSQKLLKGLNGERKVFLNLELNKGARLSTAFGDGEAGLGTNGRYNVTPVIFSMYGKNKIGLIGNYNSIGNGIGFQQERELKNEKELDASNLLMRENGLYLLNNFENRWYIKNNQWDSRFQINTPVSKKVKSSTEINYVRDNQHQNTFLNSVIYNGAYYQNRIDTNLNSNSPRIWMLRQTFDVNPDSTSQLLLRANAFIDRSRNQGYSIYRGFDINSPLARSINNNWNSLDLSATYTVRKTANVAHTFALSVNRQSIDQLSTIASGDIGKIFNSPFPYDQMNVGVDNTYSMLTGSWSSLRKGKSGMITNVGFTANYLVADLSNSTSVGKAGQAELLPDSLNGNGQYTIANMLLNLRKSIRTFFKKPLAMNADIGVSFTTVNEQKRDRKFNNLVVNAALVQEFDLLKIFGARVSAAYTQNALNTAQLIGNYYPSTGSSFYRSRNIDDPQKILRWDYSMAYNWDAGASRTSISVGSQYRLTNKLSSYQYNYFVQTVTDSLINNSTKTLFVNLNNQIPVLLINALINIDISYNRYGQLLALDRTLQRTNYQFIAFQLSLKKNWDKRYFIRLQNQYTINSYKFPSLVETNTSNTVSNFKTNFYNRFILNKQLYFVWNTNMYNNNLFTANKTTTILHDLEVNYTFKTRKPIFLSFRADNISNEKAINIFSSSATSQSFVNIPLLGRSFYASIRYNF